MTTVAGCAGSPTRESTGQYIDSAAITAKVKAKLLQDSLTAAYQIDVTTYKDTVELSGFVNTEQEKQRAVAIARGVPGVKLVENDLIVKPHT
ncbi:MAG: BON domain-containing protein [Gammaproteobacteria bacterium]